MSMKRSSTWHLKRALASLIVIGGLSFLTITSAFAVLNSQTRNTGVKISSGTLTFNSLVAGGTTCFSYGGPSSPGNVNTACDPLFSSATLMYPGTPATARVTITNDGSLDASHLSVYMPNCTVATSPGAPSPGGADPCAASGAQFTIQETNSSFVATTCRYPASAGACTFSTSGLFIFKSSSSSAPTAFDLGSGPAAGASRYFVIGVQLPATASNALQGEEALFGLTWHMST
jgi:hypothetical protein